MQNIFDISSGTITEMWLNYKQLYTNSNNLLPETKVEMWLNDMQIYTNDLWYGIKFNLATDPSPDGIRTGNMKMHKTLPVLSKMKGCVIYNSDNTLRYLKTDDWTKFDDGTNVPDNAEGGFEYFVEIPEHYRLMIADSDNNIEIRISEYALPGFIKIDKKYVSAYEGTIDSDSDTMLHSHVSSNSPLVRKTRERFQTLARTNRTTNWNMYTYDIHKDITWLFVVEYATLNSQKAFNATLTAEGYHQGGLGAGVTTGAIQINGNKVYSFVPTGVTNVLGNSTGIIEYTRETKTVNVPRYRGIENMFGHVWKNVIDVIITGTDDSVYLTKDYTKFGNDKSQLQLLDFKNALTNGYVSAITNNNNADLFPTGINGRATEYYCDYYYTNPVTADRTLLISGHSNNGSAAGLFYLASNDGLGASNIYICSRLTFYGEPVKWYGVRFEGSSTTGTRTGSMQMHKSLPIQSGMKGCTIASDGTVKYLNPTDWTRYEDGTARDMTLNTMVEIPDHSILFIPDADNPDNVEVRISPYRLPGFIPVKKQYVSAYETYCTGGVAKSIKGQIPTVNTTRASFQEQSRANGSIHWNMYTYEAHKAITWLFVVEYANRNSQANFNSNLTADGYHQGGLGAGVTTGKNGDAYSFVPTGTTDSLGNSTGVVSYAASSITVDVPRYRGIENPFGHIWKNVIDVIFYGTDNGIYINKDYTTFSNDRSDCKLIGNNATSGGYLKRLINNSAGDLFASVVGGSVSTYYCDNMLTNATNSDRTLLIGGSADAGALAGLFRLDSSGGLGRSDAHIGGRLTYLI